MPLAVFACPLQYMHGGLTEARMHPIFSIYPSSSSLLVYWWKKPAFCYMCFDLTPPAPLLRALVRRLPKHKAAAKGIHDQWGQRWERTGLRECMTRTVACQRTGRPIRIRLANADLLLAMFFLHKDCVNCLISAWLVNPFARKRYVSDI